MLAKLRISATAKRDLKGIWKYIAHDSPEAADRLLDHFDATFLMLAKSPRLGRSREDLAPGIRSFPVGDYVAFYHPKKGGITIVRVLSGRRDLDSIFSDDANIPTR